MQEAMESYGHFSPFYRLSEVVPLGWLVRAAMPDERLPASPWHTRSPSSEREGLGAEEDSLSAFSPETTTEWADSFPVGRLIFCIYLWSKYK